MDIESLFPQIKEAQAYLKHGNYSSALEVYTEILNDIDQDTEEYSHILLQYAQCLLDCVMYQSEMNYKRIIQIKKPSEDNEIEEDLENAWECLETCRLYFEDLENHSKLAEVHKGIADILCLQNNFKDGKVEYYKALDFNENELQSIEILECIADCYRNMDQFKESIDIYKEAAALCNKLGMAEQAQEYEGLMEGIEIIKMRGNESDVESEKESKANSPNSDVIRDVNHLKRA